MLRELDQPNSQLPIAMIDVNEVKIRLALAELEKRRIQERSKRNSARWRLGFMIVWTLAILVLGFVAQKSKLEFSGPGWIGLICTCFLGAGWRQYRASEELHELQAEVFQLKEQMRDKTAGR